MTLLLFVFIIFMPGFVSSFLFFQKEDVDFIERFAFSLAFSITLVPLIAFALNILFQTKITLVNITLIENEPFIMRVMPLVHLH